MGSYNISCGISSLEIKKGDKILFFLFKERIYSNSGKLNYLSNLSNDREPREILFSLLIGEYNEYGFIENYVDVFNNFKKTDQSDRQYKVDTFFVKFFEKFTKTKIKNFLLLNETQKLEIIFNFYDFLYEMRISTIDISGIGPQEDDILNIKNKITLHKMILKKLEIDQKKLLKGKE